MIDHLLHAHTFPHTARHYRTGAASIAHVASRRVLNVYIGFGVPILLPTEGAAEQVPTLAVHHTKRRHNHPPICSQRTQKYPHLLSGNLSGFKAEDRAV